MFVLLLLLAAHAASPWRAMPADVRAEVAVDAPPERVVAALSDLRAASALFDEGCVKDWSVGVPSSGVGAMARATYTPSWMHRRLTLTVRSVDARAVVWDHAGDRGFVSTFTVSPAERGANVVVEVPMMPPPWPVGKVYQVRVKPAWEACYVAALRRVGRAP